MIGLLVLMAHCLFSFTTTLKRHVEKITRIIRKVIEFWEREERTEKEKKIVISILATVLAVFIFLNMTCLVLVLTGYI